MKVLILLDILFGLFVWGVRLIAWSLRT